MIDHVIKEINENNLEKAKILIQKIENDLQLEKSEYTRGRMMEKLNAYKKLYASKIAFEKIRAEKIVKKPIELERSTEECTSLCLENLQDQTEWVGATHANAKINQCHNCVIDISHVEQSIVITNCTGLIVRCSSSQIRLKSCNDVTIIGFVKSGISLQDCTNIRIQGTSAENNNYKNVKDFSSPFNPNFTFVDDCSS